MYTGVTEHETNQLHLMTDLCNSSRKVVSSQFVGNRLTNFMGQSPSEKLTGHQPVQKYPAFYETPRFITSFTTAHHSSLFWAKSIQFMPYQPTSWSSILILSSSLHLHLPSGLFPSGLLTKTLYAPLLSPMCATGPAHHFMIWSPEEKYRSQSFLLCSLPHSPVTLSLLGQNWNQSWMVETVVLTLRRLMSYIYGAPILDVSRSHTTTQHSR